MRVLREKTDDETFEINVVSLLCALLDENVTYRDLAVVGALAGGGRRCSKGELSQLLFPNRNPRSSLNQFNRWFGGQPQLRTCLLALGWRPGQRFFTAPQAEAILSVARTGK